MYPFFWTTRERGIIMRYSHEYKLKCIDMYRQGIYPETPPGVSTKGFRDMIYRWNKIEELNDSDAILHKKFNRVWTPEEKMELISKVLAGYSNQSVAHEAGISSGMLYQWVRIYKEKGYNGLVSMKKGRPCKDSKMKKDTNPRSLTESEREELIRLRNENEYLRTENEAIKKRIALRQEKWALQLKAKKQQLSKSSEQKDSN